jgi:galactonate dehydratase
MPVIRDLTVQAVREPVSRREYSFLTVHTDAGVTGLGEVSSSPVAVAAIMPELKRLLAGQDATAVENCRRVLTGSPGEMALAAVNSALLDITGKIAKVPVYQVLGGPTRFKARAAASLHGRTPPELLGSLKQAQPAGFRSFLVPLSPPAARNQGQAFVRGVRQLLEQLRTAAGDGIDFVLDCQGALTPGDAQMMAKELESLHLLWLDEPCPALNLAAAAKISGESVTPVGFGRHVTRNSEFQDLLRQEALDVIRPDIARHGISQIRRAAALAETYYVAVAPYHRGGPVATAACLHLAASIPNFVVQEIPWPAAAEDRRMRAELVGAGVESVTEGFFQLSTGPGLGISLNPDAVQKYRAL